MLLRCGSRMMGGRAAAMGGVMLLAAAGPFLAGIGVGAGIVGGACLARRALKRRSGWKDDSAVDTAAEAAVSDAGEAYPLGAPD
jgi:hypothetical protein